MSPELDWGRGGIELPLGEFNTEAADAVSARHCANPKSVSPRRFAEELSLKTAQNASQAPKKHVHAKDRNYTFFTTTSEPTLPDGEARDLIRRVVMRNFFENKTTSPEDKRSEILSKETVNAQTQLKTKFRVASTSNPDKRKGTRTKNGDTGKPKSKEQRKTGRAGKTATKSPIQTSRPAESPKEETHRSKGSELPQERGLDRSESRQLSKPRLLLKGGPNVGKFDPFDVLPIPGTPQLDTLFKLHKSGSRANSIAINAGKTWWSFISNDAALLHATLATWAFYGVVAKGLEAMRVEQLRHKNEAIRHVNLKLNSSPETISDELVGAVLTLASFENLLGEYDVAQMHMRALKRMVTGRGGIFSFSKNDGLMRGIVWVDFHSATVFRTPPMFPQIRLESRSPTLPDALLEEAVYTSPTSLLQLSLAAIDLFNVFYRLHRLAIATSSRWLPQVDHATLSDLLYEMQYTVLSIPDYSRSYIDFDRGSRETDSSDQSCPDRAAAADSASVVEALLAAVQIFVYAALRELPHQAKLFEILLARLRSALDRPAVDMMTVWKNERNSNTLLWVLVTAAIVVEHRPCRSWWIQKVAEGCQVVGVTSLSSLQRVLETVAWNDVFFEPSLHVIWKEAEDAIPHVWDFGDDAAQGFFQAIDGVYDETDDYFQTYDDKGKLDQEVEMEFEWGRWRDDDWFVSGCFD